MADAAEALGLWRDPADDYRDVPPPRGSRSASPTAGRALTALGALVVGLLLAVGINAGRTAAVEETARKTELVSLIRARQEHTAALGLQLEELRARVAEAETRMAAGVPALRRELNAAQAAAGLTKVRGPGVRVQLTDAAGACPTGRQEDCRIQDVDLQLLVNALFAAGAEAVAINGERVVTTTAVRSAGQSVLMNYRVLVTPYVVEAVGDAATLPERFSSSAVATDFGVWKDVYGLGFTWQAQDELEIPAYGGSVRLRTAIVADDS